MIMTERYENQDGDILNFSTHGDQVLQHKKFGTEMAHITLHADGPHVREKRNARPLRSFVNNGLQGFSPPPSEKLRAFLRVVKGNI